jgi:putative transposase
MRRCCRVLGLRRESVYYKSKRINEDVEIVHLLKSKACEEVTWGFRLLYYWCRNQGKNWNKKRVYRLYKASNLHLRSPQTRKRVKREAMNFTPAEQINKGWSMDFLSDVLKGDQARVRILNVIDECSRKVLLSYASKSIKARKLVKLLEELIAQKGQPAYFRCDNGPEFISKELREFAKKHQIEIKFSQPGKPTQNALVERLNGTQRKECLNPRYFKTVQEVQRHLDKWWNSYNFDRPHSALGYLTPQQFIDKNQNLYFKVVAA